MRIILFFLFICLAQNTLADEFLPADSVKAPAPKVYIVNEGPTYEPLQRSVKNILINNYFSVVLDSKEADMLIILKCQMKKSPDVVKGEMYDFKEYFTTVGIQLVDMNNSQVLFDYILDNQRTLSPVSASDQTSQNNAVRGVLQPVERGLDKQLKKELNRINAVVAQSRVEAQKKQQIQEQKQSQNKKDKKSDPKSKQPLSKYEQMCQKINYSSEMEAKLSQLITKANWKTITTFDKLHYEESRGVYYHMIIRIHCTDGSHGWGCEESIKDASYKTVRFVTSKDAGIDNDDRIVRIEYQQN